MTTKKTDKSIDEKLADIEQEKQLEKLRYRNFAMDSVAFKTLEVSRGKKFNKKDLKNWLKNPYEYKNITKLQQASRWLMANSGTYYRMIRYLGDLLTFNHTLYPFTYTNENASKLETAFYETAQVCDKMNIEYNYRLFTNALLVDGEVYLYKLQSSDGSIVYKQIPSNVCRVSLINDNVYQYEINIADTSVFTDKTIVEYPSEIQYIYQEYKQAKLDGRIGKSTSNGVYVQLGDDAFAFTFFGVANKSIPPFAFLFPDLVELDDIKEFQLEADKTNNLRLVHQKIPTDKETGDMLMDSDDARVHHEALKKNMPTNVGCATTPMEVTTHILSKTNSSNTNMALEALTNIYNSAGITQAVFNPDKITAEILKRSMEADASMMYTLLNQYANYINKELKRTKNKTWKIKFLKNNSYDAEDQMKNHRENMSFGGSRMLFLASTGLTPLEAFNLIRFEQAINIDEILVPKQNANTLSKNETSDEGGKPKTNNPAPSTEANNNNN